ncbi:hypothetical protein FRC14_008112 [Serendipita sp. 396]|nr:hypothetical protein FRC14_008112 [Serendipita sp. 396]KAG8828751.1 hypothetical protein FRC19_000139 [Serendipita sp. 401]KAG8849029.1 hypothetical protein FRB91_010305 [Serendipita sp. 411]KAG8870782.1 hypothetical protein FRC20_011329 [Serendipita sp. 405]KAG9057346.1 hypothetical protein FS842_007259 [Serendipita sp. 407]
MQRISRSLFLAASSPLKAPTRIIVSSPVKRITPSTIRWNSSGANKPTETPQKQSKAPNPDWSAPVMTYEEIKARVRAPPPGTFVVDVRERDEVAQGAIPTAVNIPLSEFVEALRLPSPQFRDKYGFAKPARDSDIVFYCRSGKRSATAADSAKDNGFTNIKNYSGSWLDWVKRTQENDYNL